MSFRSQLLGGLASLLGTPAGKVSFRPRRNSATSHTATALLVFWVSDGLVAVGTLDVFWVPLGSAIPLVATLGTLHLSHHVIIVVVVVFMCFSLIGYCILIYCIELA